MSKETFKILKVIAQVLSIALAIGAIIYNPGHLFTAGFIWFSAEELL